MAEKKRLSSIADARSAKNEGILVRYIEPLGESETRRAIAQEVGKVVGRALRRLDGDLVGHCFIRDLATSLPEVSGDAVLLEQRYILDEPGVGYRFMY